MIGRGPAPMIPLGLPLAPWLGPLSASVQRATSPAAMTEAFTWTFTVITVGQAAGSAFGGLVVQVAGLGAGFLTGGAAALAGTAFGVLFRSRLQPTSGAAV